MRCPEQPLIADLKQKTSQAVRLAAVEVRDLGGPEAVAGFVHDTLAILIAVAFVEQGAAWTCALMAEGERTAEALGRAHDR